MSLYTDSSLNSTATTADIYENPSALSLIQNTECYGNIENSLVIYGPQLLMGLVVLTLNASVVGAIISKLKKKIFRKPAFLFICALSMTDILLGLSLVIVVILTAGAFQFRASTWVVITGFTSISFNASVNFLLVIAIDRLMFIAFNRTYKAFMTKRNVILLIIMSCATGTIPVFFLAGDLGSCSNICNCHRNFHLSCPEKDCSILIIGFKKKFLFGLFFYFLIMLISIVAVYSMLFWKVHKQGKKIITSNQQTSRRMSREYRLARTLILIVVVFVLCWGPTMILYVVEFANDNFEMDEFLIQAFFLPTIINSILNPIVYAARIPMLKKLLCACCITENDAIVNSETSTKKGISSISRKFHLKKSLKITKEAGLNSKKAPAGIKPELSVSNPASIDDEEIDCQLPEQNKEKQSVNELQSNDSLIDIPEN